MFQQQQYQPQQFQKKIIRGLLAVRLKHVTTGLFLHSHNINYSMPFSSQQQEVTCFNGHDDNNWWIIKNQTGGPIMNNDVLIFSHYATEKNLHSHKIRSPVTNQQEVCGFGQNCKGDDNDFWIIEFSDPQNTLRMDTAFKLKHRATGGHLHSHQHNLLFGSKQQEITCFYDNNQDDAWVIDMDNEQITQMFIQKHNEIKMLGNNSCVRIKHMATNMWLHSHNINYSHPRTSGQQEITCYSQQDDNNFWVIRTQGQGAIVDGSLITLTHRGTMKNIHSHHNIPSPVTNQQEVTGFGNNGVGDANDVFRVVINKQINNINNLTQGTVFGLQHVPTNQWLHSHQHNLNQGSRQQEITCYGSIDENNNWQVDLVNDQFGYDFAKNYPVYAFPGVNTMPTQQMLPPQQQQFPPQQPQQFATQQQQFPPQQPQQFPQQQMFPPQQQQYPPLQPQQQVPKEQFAQEGHGQGWGHKKKGHGKGHHKESGGSDDDIPMQGQIQLGQPQCNPMFNPMQPQQMQGFPPQQGQFPMQQPMQQPMIQPMQQPMIQPMQQPMMQPMMPPMQQPMMPQQQMQGFPPQQGQFPMQQPMMNQFPPQNNQLPPQNNFGNQNPFMK